MEAMKDPAILFYTSDFLTGVSGFTMEERGQYITLLCLQHQLGHLNEKTIRLNVGSVSVDVMAKFIKDENNLFYNEVLQKRIDERVNFLESRRLNGMKGGRPKANNKPLAKPSAKPSEKLPENEDGIENISITEDENKRLVKRFGDKATKWMIEKLSNYKGSTGKEYKSDYRAILNWVKDEYEKQHPKTGDENIVFK